MAVINNNNNKKTQKNLSREVKNEISNLGKS